MTFQQNTKLTPLLKLQHRKELIQQESDIQMQKLNEHFSYIKENAGSLALSGISSMLFSGSKTTSSNKDEEQPALAVHSDSPLSFLNHLSLAKGLFPVVLEIAQPFLITWGFKTVRKLITGLFSKKKK